MSPATTPLLELHLGRGATMTSFAGFEMPVRYPEGILAEHRRVRAAVGLFDVSHMGEVFFRGPRAIEAVNHLITNDLDRIGTGRAQYSAMCAPDGTIVDDLICYRLASDEVLICVNASNRATDVAHMREHTDPAGVEIVDESDAWGQIAVQGPRAPELLGRVLGAAVGTMRPFRVRRVDWHGAGCLVATTGYTGERGGEIYVPAEAAAELWLALEAAGADLDVGPVGLGARDTLRLEMAYCLYGNDISRQVTPLEAGLAWVTRLKRGGDWVGRSAVLAQKEAGVPRRLVGLEVVDKGIPRHGYPILYEGEPVGEVTSGTRSPSTGRSIGLGYVRADLIAPDTPLHVDCRGRVRRAVVVPTPFYTPGGPS